MASREIIEQLLAEISSSTVRTFTPAQVEDLAGAHVRRFKQVSSADVTAAFDSWVDSLGEENPKALPTPNQIWGHMKRAKQRAAPDSSTRHIEKADPVFVAGHIDLRDTLRTVFAGTSTKHKHEEPKFHPDTGAQVTTGREKCKECKASRERVEKMKAAIADLPAPAEGATRPCRCDGTGWVDTKKSLQRHSAEFGGVGEVYPCPTCRFEQFHEWKYGEPPESAAS